MTLGAIAGLCPTEFTILTVELPVGKDLQWYSCCKDRQRKAKWPLALTLLTLFLITMIVAFCVHWPCFITFSPRQKVGRSCCKLSAEHLGDSEEQLPSLSCTVELAELLLAHTAVPVLK